MALNKCCCCVDLRTGAIIIAILGLLGSFGNFGSGIAIGIVTLIGGIVANVCLLVGAIKYNRTTTLIYLIMEAIFIILYIVGLVLLIVVLAGTGMSACWDNWDLEVEFNGDVANCAVAVGILSALLVAFSIGIAISIYFWVCIYSFYQDLKRQFFPSPA